jgi:hypothetical protein
MLVCFVYASVLSYEEEDTCQVATNRLSLYVYASLSSTKWSTWHVCVLCELARVCARARVYAHVTAHVSVSEIQVSQR